MSYDLRRICNHTMSSGRNATVLMDPDYVLGKSFSTAKPNVGIFAANGYKCYPPNYRNRPRPADVKRLSMPVSRPPPVPAGVSSMPTLQKGRCASTPQLFPPGSSGERRSTAPQSFQACDLKSMKRNSSVTRF
ncbi:unnamed protein product [Cladocopium goreaui]|uniref:Uncharacterized protein n=1 Tax=Cladocopium goreaui TaxID=2562237 RepID=A0A9P1DL99_9DINO|nr:unnamed protein product [Cladocopium goreaui]|mmetsp:Transcript_73443/g.162207  ORF Transcript_73443/g.162207 Transcript_73443/m.162207 type:complete len:133 (+) Transcript_73443:93-491(+)